MAKFQIEVDTDDKTMSASINGTSVSNISEVRIYTYRDDDGNVTSLDVTLEASVKADDLYVMVSYYACASEKAKYALASGNKVYTNIDGFVGVARDSVNVAQDIDKYLTPRMKVV